MKDVHEQISEAAADILARKLGVPPSPRHHPLADEHAALAFAAITDAVAGLGKRANGSGGNSTFSMAPLLADAVGQVIAISYTESSDHRKICKNLLAGNYGEFDYPSADIALKDLDKPLPGETGEYKNIYIDSVGGATAAVVRRGWFLKLSRRLLVDDRLGAVSAAILGVAGLISRLEARNIYGLLGENPVLPSGRTMFNETDDNLISGAQLDATNLGVAVGKLRSQKTLSGNNLDVPARYLIVSAYQEVAARALIRSVTVDGSSPMSVIATSEIPNGTWYVLASPDVAPVLGFVTLDVNGKSYRADVRNPFHQDASEVRVVSEHAVTALSRVGAVKATS